MIAAVVAVVAACAAIVAITWLAHRRWMVVVVRGGSMAPTLRDGQQLLARRGRNYRRGDLVVFRPPPLHQSGARDAAGLNAAPPDDDAPGDPTYRIKRVAAVAGDAVPPWLAAAPHPQVPAHHLVVSGDHPVSEDSRHFGFVSDDAVLGYLPAPAAAPAGGSATSPASE